jgi:hypothetical protein
MLLTLNKTATDISSYFKSARLKHIYIGTKTLKYLVPSKCKVL